MSGQLYRSNRFQAFAWRYQLLERLPWWLSFAIGEGHIRFQGDGQECLIITYRDPAGATEKQVSPGDWLLRMPAGVIYRCDAATFARHWVGCEKP
jgi:hypothetical protein